MKRKNIVFHIFATIWKHAPLAVVISLVSYICFALCTTISTKILADLFQQLSKITTNSNQRTLYLLIGLYLSIFIFRKIINVVSDLSLNIGLDEKCRYYLKMDLHKKVSKLPLIDFEDSEILNQLQRSIDCIDNVVIPETYMNILNVMECLLTVVGLFIVMLGFSYWYVPILFVTMLPYFISRLVMGKEFYRLHWFQASRTRRRDYLFQLFSKKEVQKEQRVFRFGEYIKGKWDKERANVEQETWEFRKKDSRRLLFCELLVTVGYIAGIILSFILVASGAIGIGVFGASIFAFQDVQFSIKNLFVMLGSSFGSLLDAGEYFKVLSMEEEKQGCLSFQGLKHKIELSDIHFTYPNTQKEALTNNNLTIHKGEKVVIVGENGSGKTTLSKVLIGLYTPNQGSVSYDAIDLKDMKKQDLYQLIGAVSQNYVSYQLSLREQFAMSDLKQVNNDERMGTVLKAVGLESLIEKNDNLDKTLGREFDGLELSGGQWQRLAIARALFKEYEIIILDEPTSALDPITETEILKQFLELAENKTAIIISHRVGLCKFADKVIFMKNGEIIESGKHEELLEKGIAYKEFYYEQAKWYATEKE